MKIYIEEHLYNISEAKTNMCIAEEDWGSVYVGNSAFSPFTFFLLITHFLKCVDKYKDIFKWNLKTVLVNITSICSRIPPFYLCVTCIIRLDMTLTNNTLDKGY